MKFSVSSSKMYARLQAVSRVLVPQKEFKILENVLFDLNGNILTLTASDNETTICTSLEVENAVGAGKAAVGAKLLLDTLKEFSEQPLSFEIDENNFALSIQSVNGVYSFVGLNGNEYPEMDSMEQESNAFDIKANTLVEAISKTIFCAADDEIRPVMNGIYFDLYEDHASIVATDAHRLVRFTDMAIHVPAQVGFILPKKPAMLLKNILGKEEDVKVIFGVKLARFEFENTTIVCRQIEGRYPKYEAVIPQSNPNNAVVDRQSIINACKRVSVYSNNGTSLVKLSLSENAIKISAQDIDFSTSAEETIPCSYTGEPLNIGFKAPFFIDLLNAIPSTEVILSFADGSRAGLILPSANEENQDLLMLIMPMLLND